MGIIYNLISLLWESRSGERVHLGWRRLKCLFQAEKSNVFNIVKANVLSTKWGTGFSSVSSVFGMFDQESVIETCASSLHGYWSSSENNNNNAWNQRFSDGNQNNNNKNNTISVRCVRSWKLFPEPLFIGMN